MTIAGFCIRCHNDRNASTGCHMISNKWVRYDSICAVFGESAGLATAVFAAMTFSLAG